MLPATASKPSHKPHLLGREQRVCDNALQRAHRALRHAVAVKVSEPLDKARVAQHAARGVPRELVARRALLLHGASQGVGARRG